MNINKKISDMSDKDFEKQLYRIGKKQKRYALTPEREEEIYSNVLSKLREDNAIAKTKIYKIKAFFGLQSGFRFSPQLAAVLFLLISITAIFIFFDFRRTETTSVNPQLVMQDKIQIDTSKMQQPTQKDSTPVIIQRSETINLARIRISNQSEEPFGFSRSKVKRLDFIESILKENKFKIWEISDTSLTTEWLYGLYNDTSAKIKIFCKTDNKNKEYLNIGVKIITGIKTNSKINLDETLRKIKNKIKPNLYPRY